VSERFKVAVGTCLLATILFLVYCISSDFSAVTESSFRLSAGSFLVLRVTIALFCVFLIISYRLQSLRLVLLVLFFCFLLMLYTKWMQHLSFNTHSHDVGLFHSAIWNSLHGQWMFDSVRGQFYLADHLIFFLFFFIPFYWIYPGPETLYCLSAVAFSGAAFIIYKLAEEQLKNKLAAFLILIAFSTNRYIWGAFLHEFHPDFFAPVFFFLLFLSFYKKKFYLFFISLFCILILKEDYALYLIPAGLYFLIQKGRRAIGLATIFISTVYFLAAYCRVLPYFSENSGSYTYINSWSHLGSGPADVLKNLFLNPSIFLFSISYKTIVTFFTKFIFLPFLSPATLLFVLPPLFLYTSAQFELIRGLSIHYGLIPATFAFIALVEGLRNLGSVKGMKNAVLILISIFCTVSLYKPTFYLPILETREFQLRQAEFSKKRPACVQSSLFPHLIPSGEFSIFPECSDRAKYLFLFTKADPYPFSKLDFEEAVSRLSDGNIWELRENSGGLMLFERKGSHA